MNSFLICRDYCILLIVQWPINLTHSCFSSSTAHVDNKTRILNIVAHRIGWNFVILSWNAITAVGGHVTYRVTSKGRHDIIDKVTSNTSMLLSGLDQLTRYKIKVQAQEKNGGSLLASAVVVLNTLGEF